MNKFTRLLLAFVLALAITVVSGMLLFLVVAAFSASPGLTLVALGMFIFTFLVIEHLMDKEFN